MLESLAPLLADDEKDEIAEHLEKQSDPFGAIDRLARSSTWREDTPLLEALVRFEREHFPDSPHTEYLLGLIDQIDGQYEAAAAHHRAAWEADPGTGRRDEYVWHYLDAMVSGGQLIAGYENAPDPTKAFRYLTGDYEEDEAQVSRDDLIPLVDAHLKRVPDDPWGHYYRSVLAGQANRPDEAAQHLRTALEKTDDEDLWDWSRRELATSADAGRVDEAYREWQPPADAFQELAEQCHSEDNYEGLRQLVQLHRDAEPSDPWLDYYEALCCQHEGNFAEAERLLARGYAAATEELESRYRDLSGAAPPRCGRPRGGLPGCSGGGRNIQDVGGRAGEAEGLARAENADRCAPHRPSGRSRAGLPGGQYGLGDARL